MKKLARVFVLTAALVSGVGFVGSIFKAQANATEGNCVLQWDHGNPGCPSAKLGNCCCC